jgi:hypothetical protein
VLFSAIGISPIVTSAGVATALGGTFWIAVCLAVLISIAKQDPFIPGCVFKVGGLQAV